MKFSKAWVDELVASGLDTEGLCSLITMAGLEVDTCEKVAGDFDKVVIAEVVECKDHPNSDHLHITKINAGTGELLDIVCGAPNCRQGLKVCCALVGATLPGDFTIKPCKLRGEPSNGMLCSYKELGVDAPSEGIIELPSDAPIGMSVREYFKWDDSAIEVDLTANRADCLSLRGIAREVSVLSGKPFAMPEFAKVAPTIDVPVSIKVEDPAACPKYLGRVLRGLNKNAVTPLWMAEKLRRCGLRTVDPIVDVTNFVMLEYGQPLHAFDLGKLSGGIIVRRAKQGEKLVLLSGDEVELRTSTLVISDENAPLALAGIYGGKSSGISEETTDVFLECAWFSPDAVKGEAREYGLATDASHRYERGVDYEIQETACERATQLLIEICGGEASQISKFEDKSFLPKMNPIELKMSLVHRVIGNGIVTEDEVLRILNGLGIKSEKKAEGIFESVSPSWRIDINIAEDLIEEVARIHGYNNIPNLPPLAGLRMGKSSLADLPVDRLKDMMADRGYAEVVTYSFVDEGKMASLFPNLKPMVIPKPITADMNAMRISVLPGLLQVIAGNNARQQQTVRVFESSLRFVPDASAPHGVRQIPTFAAAACGSANGEQWGLKDRNVDFYDVKGDLEALLGLTGYADRFSFVAVDEPAFHPGQSAAVLLDGKRVGTVGLVHPTAQKKYGVKQKTFAFEIDLDALSSKSVPVSASLSKFQANRRDIAVVVDSSVSAGDLVGAVKSAGIASLQDAWLFDLYEGENLGEGKKSLAIALILQDAERTLEDADIEAGVQKALAVLSERFGAVLRA